MAVPEISTEQLSAVFDKLDTNKNGKLCRQELAQVFRGLEIEPTRLEMDYLFSHIDKDKSGSISKDEFIGYMNGPPTVRVTMKQLTEEFQVFDTDGDGAISYEELEQVIRKVSNLDDMDIVQTMFTGADKNADGRITFQEFCKIMKEA